ncbi:class I SAM-dependent methyltransferase [Candidatus Poribacteria bacterium]|nr:class I SAM-dependent methyltransferase [Candidatus Poribacteria bacterium]
MDRAQFLMTPLLEEEKAGGPDRQRINTMSVNANIPTLYDKALCSKYKILTSAFFYPRGIRDFILQGLPIKDNDRILDAGCGHGILSRAIRSKIKREAVQGTQQFAFDISDDMLQGFRKTGADGIDLRRLDVRELSYDNDFFDLIVTSAMLEYVPDIENALSSLKRCLKPGGKIYVFMSKKTRLNHFLFQPFGKPRCYSFPELTNILLRVGFQNIERQRFPASSFWLNIWGIIVEAGKT